jgi:alginate O-acetyltransferase complex protein AlgI
MAVGLGKMFGFTFLENFNFPYIARSMTDFWRRWHISLSSWFRDYLYIPLGGNRHGLGRTFFNLLTVFFLCGLWHGASWTFVIWGLYNGAFLILERTRAGQLIEWLPSPIQHLYLVFTMMIGWLIFRADTFAHALSLFGIMFDHGVGLSVQPISRYLTHQVIFALIAGAIFSTPAWSFLKQSLQRASAKTMPQSQARLQTAGSVVEFVIVLALFAISCTWLAGSTHNPFIYYRF